MAGPSATYHLRAEGSAGGRARIDAGNQTILLDARWATTKQSGLSRAAELLAGVRPA